MKISTIIRAILYILYLPFVVLLVYLLKLIFGDSKIMLGLVYDMIFNPDVVLSLELKRGAIAYGLGAFFAIFLLPLDLLLLRVVEKVDKVFFMIVFSIPVFINTILMAIMSLWLCIKFELANSFPIGFIFSPVGLVLIIHLIRVVNTYWAVFYYNNNNYPWIFDNGFNDSHYFGVMWLALGFLVGESSLGLAFVAFIGLIIAVWLFKKWERCSKCGTWVKGKTKDIYQGTSIYTDRWTTNEKVGELRDKKGNSIDVYQQVNHSKDVEYDSYKNKLWLECHHCGHKWWGKW